MKIIKVGTRVRVLHTITDDGGPPDESAEAVGPGYIHAREGEEGVVIHIENALTPEGPTDEAAINVEFDRTGTVSMVLAEEIEVAE